MTPTGVLFVCMGNICRSPAAEAIFRSKASAQGAIELFSIDSCGTGSWHDGEQADARMRAAAKSRGFEITSRARQIKPACLTRFDHIICMDANNRRDVLALGRDARVELMLDFSTRHIKRDVPDPYYGDDDGFEVVLDLLDEACEGLLRSLLSAQP